jgi:hypothetical protein
MCNSRQLSNLIITFEIDELASRSLLLLRAWHFKLSIVRMSPKTSCGRRGMVQFELCVARNRQTKSPGPKNVVASNSSAPVIMIRTSLRVTPALVLPGPLTIAISLKHDMLLSVVALS